MDDDPIKLESASGITVGDQTLEEYVDEQAVLEGVASAEKTVKDASNWVFSKRTDKRQRGAKQRYYGKRNTRIFSKREIYKEYKGVLLMEMSKTDAPLSKLVIQTIMDGERKEPADIITDINTNTNTGLTVNIGSVSSVLTKIKKSNLGFLIKTYKVAGQTVQPIQVHDLAKNLEIDDAHLLYLNKLSLDAAIEKYPELSDIPKVKMHNISDSDNKAPEVKLPAPMKGSSLPQKLLEIMLSDCETYHTNKFADNLKKYFNIKKPNTTHIASAMKAIRDSGLKSLIIHDDQARPHTYRFIFNLDDNMDIDTLMAIYRKQNSMTIADLEKSHPTIWSKISGVPSASVARPAKADPYTDLIRNITGIVTEKFKALIAEATIDGGLQGDETINVEVSGKVDININIGGN